MDSKTNVLTNSIATVVGGTSGVVALVEGHKINESLALAVGALTVASLTLNIYIKVRREIRGVRYKDSYDPFVKK